MWTITVGYPETNDPESGQVRYVQALGMYGPAPTYTTNPLDAARFQSSAEAYSWIRQHDTRPGARTLYVVPF